MRGFLPSVPHGCACGLFGDTHRRCTCTPAIMQRSMANISGPLLDRSDSHIDVPAGHYWELSATFDGEHSAQIRQRVQQARRRQDQRFAQTTHVFCNAHMTTTQIRTICQLSSECHSLLEMAMDRLGLNHVSEAINYRSLDRELWLQQ